MPRTLVWGIPGVIAWVALQIAAVQWCTGWRDEKAKYGFVALGLLLWWLPNLAFGERGASEVEQFVLIAGFPVAALYLAGLLVSELSERRGSRRKLTG
jgi:hypothetical protein